MDATETEAALNAAINTYRRANAECAYYGLRRLAQHALATQPVAKTLVFDWSDQGDYLTLMAVEDANGNDLDEGDDDFDPAGWAGNLSETNEDTWGLIGGLRFDIAKVLADTAEPYVWDGPT